MAQQERPERAVLLQTYMFLHSQQNNIKTRLSATASTTPSSSPQLSPFSTPMSTPCSSPEMSPVDLSSSASSSGFNSTSPRPGSPPVFSLPKPMMKRRSIGRTSFSREPSISPIPEDSVLEWPSEIKSSSLADQDKLFDINADIKSTLTDLLNCEAVRNDHKTRMWVQTRLLDAERELKRQRRQRTGGPSFMMSPTS